MSTPARRAAMRGLAADLADRHPAITRAQRGPLRCGLVRLIPADSGGWFAGVWARGQGRDGDPHAIAQADTIPGAIDALEALLLEDERAG